jgi:ABC-type nitrate/sulfonate/bicarbonate transport system substrate-binding protein
VARETRSPEVAVARAYGRDVHHHLRTDLEESSIVALGDFTRFMHEWKLIPNAVDVRGWIDARPLLLAQQELALEARGVVPLETRSNAPAAAARI